MKITLKIKVLPQNSQVNTMDDLMTSYLVFYLKLTQPALLKIYQSFRAVQW